MRESEGRWELRCKEAPGVAVVIDRAASFTEAEARKLGERVVLLDGVGQLPPLVDDARHLYNLDHHVGVLRAFTLATCEQALILVLKGLELDKGDWTIYANEPDLDTLLAIWVLLNYRRVRSLSPQARDSLLPLLRLEGAIDANGFELAEHCGLTQEQVAREKERLDALHARELELKRTGAWEKADLVRYTLERLAEVDALIFTGADFQDFAAVELEHGHVDIGQDKVAVVCRDHGGIYEVERRLRKVWGERLGIVVLEKAGHAYTLRRSAPLAGIRLADAYERLNLLDPAVDGRPPDKRWGGSDDIGGSPRPGGSGLVPREVGKILKMTYRPARPWARLQRFVGAALWLLGTAVAGGLAAFAVRLSLEAPTPLLQATAELSAYAVASGLVAWILTRQLSRGWLWTFGWRWPAGRDWLWLALPALAGAAAGGGWVPRGADLGGDDRWAVIGATSLAAIALTLAFPGLAHGLLVLDARIQSVGGRWFVSRPALAAATLYAAATAGAVTLLVEPAAWGADSAVRLAVAAGGGFVVALASAMIRERSLSLLPAAAVLLAGALLRFLLPG